MFDRHAKLAFIIACLVLVIGKFGLQYTAAALNVYLQKYPVPLRKQFPSIPGNIGSWKQDGEDRTLAKEMVESLGTDLYLNRVYRLRENPHTPIDVHVAYYTGMIDAVPHVADRCLVAAGFIPQSLPGNYPLLIDTGGWKPDAEHINHKTGKPYPMIMHKEFISGRESPVRMPLGDFALRVTEFTHPEQPGARIYAGYLFVANGCTTPQPESIRLLAFDRTDKYAYYCKVQCMMMGSGDFTREKFLECVAGFMKDFLPELMRCLPDWAEVEGREQPAQTASTGSTR